MSDSPQRRWQKRKQEAGMCVGCGRRPRVNRSHCEACREKNRAAQARYRREILEL